MPGCGAADVKFVGPGRGDGSGGAAPGDLPSSLGGVIAPPGAPQAGIVSDVQHSVAKFAYKRGRASVEIAMADNDQVAADLARLRKEYQVAIDQTKAILLANGMDSPEFATAKQVAGDLWRAILALDPDAHPDVLS
jgi:hypothetical protein